MGIRLSRDPEGLSKNRPVWLVLGAGVGTGEGRVSGKDFLGLWRLVPPPPALWGVVTPSGNQEATPHTYNPAQEDAEPGGEGQAGRSREPVSTTAS